MASYVCFVVGCLLILTKYVQSDSNLKTLDDDNFEHLTQASTGATTGNWLVLFSNTNCEKCLIAKPIFQQLADKLHRRMNVAVVKEDNKDNLVRRFNIKKFPTIFLFAHGFQYRFYGEISNEKLEQFVQGGYRDTPKLAVSPPLSSFDLLTENIVRELKDAVKTRRFTSPVILGLAAVVFLMVICLVSVCCGARERDQSQSSKKED